MGDIQVIWDLPDDPGGNIAHIAEHGITREEYEDVFYDDTLDVEISSSSGQPCKFGYTSTGIFIIVVWEGEDVNGTEIITPVTAYEVEPRSR